MSLMLKLQAFDGAVGDLEVYADRFRYVEFTQPYISSGLEMVVTVKPDKVKEIWMFMKAFTKKMWLQLVFMHLSICSLVWLIEVHHGQNPEVKGLRLGDLLWFSATVLFFAQSKNHFPEFSFLFSFFKLSKLFYKLVQYHTVITHENFSI